MSEGQISECRTVSYFVGMLLSLAHLLTVHRTVPYSLILLYVQENSHC